MGGVPDEPDPAVPLPDEVGDAGARAANVVREDRVGVDHPGRAVHEYRRDPRGDFRQQIPVIAGGGNDDQPVDAPRAQGEDQFLLALRILIARSGEKQRAVPVRHIFHRPRERGVERVANVLHDQPDGGGLPLPQQPGAVVAAEAELVDGVADPAGRLRCHPGFVVDHPGHGLERHPRAGRHVFHGGPAAAVPQRPGRPVAGPAAPLAPAGPRAPRGQRRRGRLRGRRGPAGSPG